MCSNSSPLNLNTQNVNKNTFMSIVSNKQCALHVDIESFK